MVDISSVNNIDIEKSQLDTRQYRYIILDNGLRALLISSLKPNEVYHEFNEEDLSDESLDSSCCENNDDCGGNNEIKSAAALCVSVGSFSDPESAQGLSHFLEHMMFMGSKKYPKENDFDSYVSTRGGSYNAWTSNEHTVFHFDVKRKYFHGSLDRFANFFIAPLFIQDSVDRELAAVNSEFEHANSNDNCRMQRLISSFATKESPYHKFGNGNMKSLRDLPAQNNVDVYGLLRDFYEKNYSASRMTLAIESKHSLNDIETMVRDLFSNVPTNQSLAPDFRNAASFEVETFAKVYRVCPIYLKDVLMIFWTLPPQRDDYESASVHVLTSLVGHEGPGSILALLKQKNLAFALETGIGATSDHENSSFCCIFQIRIKLTDQGYESFNDICQIVFNYMKMLRISVHSVAHSTNNNSIHTRIGDQRQPHPNLISYLMEYKLLKEARFSRAEIDDPEDTVSEVANRLQLFPPELVHSACLLVKKPDLQKCDELLKLMIPQRAAIVCMFSKNAQLLKKAPQLNHESWFNIDYVTEIVNENLMHQWTNSPIPPELHLPFVNKFITTQFDLVNSEFDMAAPQDLNREPCGQDRLQYGHLWFQQTTKYECPKAYIMVHLSSVTARESVESLILNYIMVYSLEQSLDTITYEANEATLTQRISFQDDGFQIYLDGFTQNLFLLYQTILEHIMSSINDLSQLHFDSYKKNIRRSLCNTALKPGDFLCTLVQNLLYRNTFLITDIIASLDNLSVTDLISYQKRFFNSVHLTFYIFGNLTKQNAIEYFDYTVKCFKTKPIPKRVLSSTAIIKPAFYQLRVMNCNTRDVNICVRQLHLIGESDLKMKCLNKLIVSILSEPAFDYLRTKETLGYIVQLACWKSIHRGDSERGISLTVHSQSSHYDINHVSGVLNAFWLRIVPHILNNMSKEEFATAVKGAILSFQLKDLYMYSEFKRNWNCIMDGTADFAFREKCVEYLQTVTHADLIEFYRTYYVDPNRRRTILIQVDAHVQNTQTNEQSKSDEMTCSYQTAAVVEEKDSVDLQVVSLTPQLLHSEAVAFDKADVGHFVSSPTASCESSQEWIKMLDTSSNYSQSRILIDNLREFRSNLNYLPGLQI